MTATTDILGDLVEGQTYQLDTSPDGQGGTRWDLFIYQRPDSEVARVAGQGAGWHQVASAVTAKPEPGRYRAAALGWLRTLGHDPDAMDLVLILPDSLERLRP